MIRLRIDARLLAPGAELPALYVQPGEDRGIAADREVAQDDTGEVLTYVVEGTLAQQLCGEPRLLRAGEFQLRRGGAVREENASRHDEARVVQIRLCGATSPPAVEQRRFCAAERRGRLRVVASPDGHDRSLRLAHDARIYSALLDAGQHLVHALRCARHAEVHVVHGRLSQIEDGRAVSLTALEPSEILLVDLGGPPS